MISARLGMLGEVDLAGGHNRHQRKPPRRHLTGRGGTRTETARALEGGRACFDPPLRTHFSSFSFLCSYFYYSLGSSLACPPRNYDLSLRLLASGGGPPLELPSWAINARSALGGRSPSLRRSSEFGTASPTPFSPTLVRYTRAGILPTGAASRPSPARSLCVYRRAPLAVRRRPPSAARPRRLRKASIDRAQRHGHLYPRPGSRSRGRACLDGHA